MYVVKILKRKDAASIVVSIVLGLLLLQLLSSVSADLTAFLSGSERVTGLGWRETYANPLIGFVVQVLLLEAFLRVAVFLRPYFVAKKK